MIPETIRILETRVVNPTHPGQPITKRQSNKRGQKVKKTDPQPVQPKPESRVTLISQQICLEELSLSEDLHIEVKGQIRMSQKRPWFQQFF